MNNMKGKIKNYEGSYEFTISVWYSNLENIFIDTGVNITITYNFDGICKLNSNKTTNESEMMYS